MQLNHHELATRLQSWASFYSYEMWMASLATAPLEDALDATLAGPPVWVTADPLPNDGDTMEGGQWCIEELLIAAWCSKDPELVKLADHCEELGAHYLQHTDRPEPPADGAERADRTKRKL